MTKAYIVTDLSFGDAGKGTTVDYLSRQASTLVVRHNGGPQAAHNVVTPDGRHHTFAQFSSGSFVDGTITYLSRFMLVNPLNMFPEADHLIDLGIRDIWQRIMVDADAVVITPWHQAANRIRERARGEGRHGSCAQGVGETMACNLANPSLTIRVRDIASGSLVIRLQDVRNYLCEHMRQEYEPTSDSEDWNLLMDETIASTVAEEYRYWSTCVTVVTNEWFARVVNDYEQVVFEGAQGVLLDEWFGFHPFTTWSTTTSENALCLLDEIEFDGDVVRLGILRAYTTRHGPGPFVTEDASLAEQFVEQYNDTGVWQGAFRIGHLDLVAHRYAVEVNGGIDQLVVTGLDRSDSWRYCDAYTSPDGSKVSRLSAGRKGDLEHQQRLTDILFMCRPRLSPSVVNGEQLINVIGRALRAPVTLVSYGPTADNKRALVVC